MNPHSVASLDNHYTLNLKELKRKEESFHEMSTQRFDPAIIAEWKKINPEPYCNEKGDVVSPYQMKLKAGTKGTTSNICSGIFEV